MREYVKAHKWELVMIAAMLLLSLTLVLVISLTKEEGAVAVVEIDGDEVATYSLDTDGEYVLNGGTNVLVIEDGCAYLSYAECPDHTCVRTGKIRYVGESIVCLPNRLSVTVRGEGEGVDLVS